MEEPNSRDRWMVSYADFITLLFAFFVVLFASIHRNGYSVPEISEAIHRGFLNPDRPVPSAAIPRTPPFPAPAGSAGVGSTVDPSRAASSSADQLHLKLEGAISAELQNGEVSIATNPDGLVISLKEIGFFPSGEANLEPGAAEKIEEIARVLSPYEFHIRVEGHSDDRPIHNAQFHSNWELSTARAMEVLMLLIHHSNLDPSRLSVAGYGPYRPIARNTTAAGRRLNRRVDLVVVTRTAAPQPPGAIPPVPTT